MTKSAETRRRRWPFNPAEVAILAFFVGPAAGIALAQYSDQIVRKNWREVYASVAVLKLAIADCLSENNHADDCGTFANLDQSGYWSGTIPPPNRPGATVTIMRESASIVMNGSAIDKLGHCEVQLTPTVVLDTVKWVGSSSPNCAREQTGY